MSSILQMKLHVAAKPNDPDANCTNLIWLRLQTSLASPGALLVTSNLNFCLGTSDTALSTPVPRRASPPANDGHPV